jgi:hypothetical protein
MSSAKIISLQNFSIKTKSFINYMSIDNFNFLAFKDKFDEFYVLMVCKLSIKCAEKSLKH